MIIQDFNYALRLLAKKPGFTALTTLVMAAGIGISVYMFSFFNTVLYRDLPFQDGDSIVLISSSENGKRDADSINLLDYEEVRNSVKGLSEFGAYQNASVNVSGRDGARRYKAIYAQANIFAITRTKALIGRAFLPDDNLYGAESVTVIGYNIWQNQFGGEQNVIDQSLQVNGSNHRIIGVMPKGYLFPNTAQLWLPLQVDNNQLTRETAQIVHGIAHINDNSTVAEINQRLQVVMQRLELKYPNTNSGISAYITSIPGKGEGDAHAVIYSMHIVAMLILLLASINVGNLLLSRAVERGKETAIRVALGAPRSRLISQMLWESIIICSLGGVIGLLVLAWGLEITNSITATFFVDPPAFWWTFGVNAYTMKLFFTILISTILVTGLLPAWKNSGGDFNSVLRDGTRGALGKKAGRLNRILVISEIFISMAVLIAAGVMVVAAYIQSHEDIGADTQNTLIAKILLSDDNYVSAEKKVQFAQTLQTNLAKGIGIKDVMISSALPGDWSRRANFLLAGKEYTNDNNTSNPRANYIAIMPGALGTLGVELKQGRYFDSSDSGLEKKTALVSENFTKLHYPNESPIGKQLRLSDDDPADWITIVGVVENTIQGSREDKHIPTIFRPFTQDPRQQLTVAMHMSADVAKVTDTLRQTLMSIDPQLPSFQIETYEQNNARFTAPIQFVSSLVALFALAALVLAASGIYGVMANTISQRTQEIGIKRALGASEKTITREFMITGFTQFLIGGIPGLLAGCTMGFAMSQIFGTSNLAVFIIAFIMTFLIGAVVMLATYLPTRAALSMEPSEALHYE
jgi:putative ABC transport system permease protein